MTKSAVSDWDTTASNNTDIGGITLDGAVMTPSQVDNAIRELMAQIKTFYSTATIAAPPGYLYGLEMSNNGSDTVNDIDIATGAAASTATTPVLMTLASGLTKRLDAAWAVGTGNGGLDTGVIASNNYHVWLIQRSDTSVVDALYSLSATAPTMPASYDRKRRIGSVRRPGATILGFQQTGNRFILNTGIVDRTGTTAVAASNLSLSVPSGIVCRPIVREHQIQGTAGAVTTAFGDGGTGLVDIIVSTSLAGQVNDGLVNGLYKTNTSAQLSFEVVIGSGTISANTTNTIGWYDDRGQ